MLSLAVLVSAMVGFGGAAVAQKKHAPKAVWGAMVAGLSDIQNITAAMMVFDMKRATKIAEELQQRETYISKIERLPESVREGHAKVAEAAAKLVAAAKAGEEQDLSNALNGVMQACNACHYDRRDAERRKKTK
jgi:hypothetical protein